MTARRLFTPRGYDAHSGNASRAVTDLVVPGGVGDGGLKLTRYWNSNRGWSNNWSWGAVKTLHEKYGEGQYEPYLFVTHTIQIGYPDGRVGSFTFELNEYDLQFYPQGPVAWHVGSGTVQEPQRYASRWTGNSGVADHLSGMTEDGTTFWLQLSDGSSVFFQKVPDAVVPVNKGETIYRATRIIDRNGLTTELHYDDNRQGALDYVQDASGRRLKFSWGQPAEGGTQIGKVESFAGAEGAALQTVEYVYGTYTLNGSTDPNAPRWTTLDEVKYLGETDQNGQPVSANYRYQTLNNNPGAYIGTVLWHADDPRFEGPMTRISYDYATAWTSYANRPQGQGDAELDYFFPTGPTITAERSATTAIQGTSVGQLVSGFAIEQFTGKRIETRGAGGTRTFYFGQAGGPEPGSYYVPGSNGTGQWHPPESNMTPHGRLGIDIIARNEGFHLTKATDFHNDPAISEFQHYYHRYPWRTFDAKGTLTVQEWHPAGGYPYGDDGNGRPDKVRHVGAGTGFVSYNWTSPTHGTAPQNLDLLPNNWNHWLHSQTDENGNTTWYVRDELRRVTEIHYPGGTSEHFVYNHLNQVTDHRLTSDTWQHYRYRPDGFMYEEWNDADGYDARKEYVPDALGRVWQMTDGRARAHGTFTVRLTYNARHQVVREEYPSTDDGPNPTKEYRYDRYGNCIAIKNELNHWSFYEYDEYRRCTKFTEPLDPANGVSRSWDWVYDRWWSGQYASAASHTSKQWRLQIEPGYNAAGDRPMTVRTYDHNDRMIMEETGWIQRGGTAPIGDWWPGPDWEVHFFGYDANGNRNRFTDPRGRVTTYEYDKRDRLKKTIEPLNRVTENWYDWVGNKYHVQFPDGRTNRWEAFDAFGQAWRAFDERGNPTDLVYEWGPMKRLLGVTTYRQRDDGSTEPQHTSFWSHRMGRPWRTNFPDGAFEETTYHLGQPHSYKTRRRQRKWIEYDARGRQTAEVWEHEAAPRIDRKWDAAHRLSWIENIFSRIDYTYYASGSVQTETSNVAGSGGPVTVGYRRYQSGKPNYLIYPLGWWLRQDHTARGQLKATGWDGGTGNWHHKLIDYTYNADGKVAWQYYGNGTQTGFDYDERGNIRVAHTYRHQPHYQNYSWRYYHRDTRDRIKAWQKSGDSSGGNGRENGRGDRYEYDAEGQLTRAYYEAPDPANSGDGYAADDNFGGWEDGGNVARGYDAQGSRQGWNWLANRGWTYFGRRDDNRLNQYLRWFPPGGTEGSYINHDDQLPDWGWAPPGNGVVLQDGNFSMGYNALNQPTRASTAGMGGQWLHFGYDPLGRCVKRWYGGPGSTAADSNPATYYYYDGWNLVQEGPSASNAEWIYFHGQRVDEMVAAHHLWSNGWNYYHHDARGHTILLTDWWGNMVEQYDYQAFGNVYTYNGWGGYIAAGETHRGNRFLFTGREWLKDLQVYDYRHRLYQPDQGRFLQPDPLHFGAGDYNLYRYCHNDPINKVDPDGTIAFVPVLLAAWAAYEIGSTIYDGYTAAKTFSDPNASTADKLIAGGGLAASAALPGGGYGTAGKGIKSAASAAPNTNPFKGPVGRDTIIVDSKGNAIPVKSGEQLKTSPDGKWAEVKDSKGRATGLRIDDGHPKRADPREQVPHVHRDDVNIRADDGTPWLKKK